MAPLQGMKSTEHDNFLSVFGFEGLSLCKVWKYHSKSYFFSLYLAYGVCTSVSCESM